MYEEIIVALEVAVILLLSTFLWVFHGFYASIRPLIERFTSAKGGLKFPTIKEAIGMGIMKLVETTDFSKMLGTGKRE